MSAWNHRIVKTIHRDIWHGHLRYDTLNQPVLATHRYKLCPADDEPAAGSKRYRRGELDTTSLDDFS